MTRAFLDIGPMFEANWTGIPVVTAAIAERALTDTGIDWQFLYETVKIDRATVEVLLARRSGGNLLGRLEAQLWDRQVLTHAEAQSGAAIFPNLKTVRRFFQREAMIHHDFSTLLTPAFHNEDTISHHTRGISEDIATSDMNFCVSRSTAEDLRAYFRPPSDQIAILPMGVAIDPATVSRLAAEGEKLASEPFICVLGTLEPRKNASIIFDFVRRQPDFLNRYRFVFVGRDGWLDEKARLLAKVAELHAGAAERMVFSGFVPESTKLALLHFSRFVVYPSIFEGYGIPVAEAGVLGKFVVCSNTSSLPEVYPERSIFYDPERPESFVTAMKKAELASQITFLDRRPLPEVAAELEARSWDRSYKTIRDWVSQG